VLTAQFLRRPHSIAADRLAHFLVVGGAFTKAAAADDLLAEALFSSNFFAKHNDFFYYQS